MNRNHLSSDPKELFRRIPVIKITQNLNYPDTVIINIQVEVIMGRLPQPLRHVCQTLLSTWQTMIKNQLVNVSLEGY